MAINIEIELLRQVPLFAHVDRSYLQVLAFSAEKTRFKEGDFIIKEGGKVQDAAFLILRGAATAYETKGEQKRPVAHLEKGAFIGQMSMLARLPNTYDVIVDQPTEALIITQELFYRVCAEFPDTGAQILETLTKRLDGSMNDLGRVERLFRNALSFQDL